MTDGRTDRDELRATLRLCLADGVGARTFQKLVEAFGSPRAALAAGPGQWRQVQGIGEKTAAAIESVTDADVDAELAEVERAGATILCRDEEGFPAALRTIYDCPPLLYVRGRLDAADALALGVVGSRRCTYYGLEQAERFGQLLARAGFTVVSGGARGIDTAAHRGALAAGGRTIAVMGCGLGHLYPPENVALFEQIVAEGRGAIVSELPMRVDVKPGNFPLRNRIISGMSLGVLVVEAAFKSGALITANEAIDQNREVFALPGRVDSPMSQGTNELIHKHRAALVQNLDDILEHLGQVGKLMTPAEPTPEEGLFAATATLDEPQQKLVAALRDGEKAIDELVRATSMDTARVAASLTMLTIKGIVAQQAGQVFALRRRPAAGSQ
jgi:DNA processing protein